MLGEQIEAMKRACFGVEPSEADLERLGSRDRWLVYRELVRKRLQHVAGVALSRTKEAVGGRAFESAFAEWLAGGGPKSRYLREVPVELAEHAIPAWERSEPAWVADLARFELSEWRVRHAPSTPAPSESFAFDRRPHLRTTLEVLRLAHPVHRPRPPRGYDPEPTLLGVYRDSDHRPKTRELNPLAADLLEAWQAGEETVTESVQRVAAAHETDVSPAFIEKLSALIADFLAGHSPPPNPSK
jgi:hypothetical protein